jgi:hypothetical protein
MGVSLEYRAIGEVAPGKWSDIVKEASVVNSEREFWAEPIWLCEDQGHGSFGMNKIFCGIDDEDVDSFMAANDIKYILNWLGRVGTKYKVDWDISIEGGELGAILNGSVPTELLEGIDELCEAVDVDTDKMPCREELLRKYRDR